ncbi:expressed unknown protein [Seminavis robusta]|uniref:Uncharacterized protein n=1 Tax=Seminavis robusta TaxID=568900 RepID=A0A9N8DL85_9STRA|nr:expressed unknown protein [Seminavis robusta]|eukprot:Sro185_g080370.1 n/a (458) ;mRNA; r:55434-57074
MAPKMTTVEESHDATLKVEEHPLNTASEESSASDSSLPDCPTNADSAKGNEPSEVIGDDGVKKRLSLEDRSRIPGSFWVSIILIGLLEGCSGMYTMDTVYSWWDSITTSLRTVKNLLEYERDLMWSAATGEFREPDEYLRAALVTIVSGSILWVLIGKPMSAGLWTGQRSTRHKMHRYMGLCFLIQYSLAWVEFITNYEGAGEFSFVPHTVALNGVIQGYSAYFSFRVLPNLKDAGYYSDKGVMSRDFLHENICFNVFCVFGAVYNNNALREVLQSNIGGRIAEFTMVFYPFVLIRPWFPTTRLKDAGSREKTRSANLERFYQIGTTMIKIFYLWAKYFLGFHLNFMLFLGLIKPENMRFMQGLHLLNTGTVAIAMFLHTLRFKKILPAKFTFSFYIAQVYATFCALPYAIDTFMSHPKLAALSFSGLLCNMTRSRAIHSSWCVVAMLLVACTDIDW